MNKFCGSLTQHAKNVINFFSTNVSINKRRNEMTSRYKSILYMSKRDLQKVP